jgi:galactonate dehydratase
MFPKIKSIETISCDASWRNYHFCKIVCEDGTVGWSEYDEGFGAPGVGHIINRLALRVVGPAGRLHRDDLSDTLRGDAAGLRRGHRPGDRGDRERLAGCQGEMPEHPGSMSCSAGESATDCEVYWSHCATWRISRGDHYGNAITHLDGGRGTRARGAGARLLGPEKPTSTPTTPPGSRAEWAPGFAHSRSSPSSIWSAIRRRACLLTWKRCARVPGRTSTSCWILNFHFRNRRCHQPAARAGRIRVVLGGIRTPKALRRWRIIRSRSPFPIASCETILGLREFLPFFERRAIDVAMRRCRLERRLGSQ